MVNIEDILNYVHNGVKAKDPRFEVLDSEHLVDTKTGVEYHLYDEGVNVTHGEYDITKKDYFSPKEQSILFEIKKLITDPAEVAQKIAEAPKVIKNARELFADLYEHPRDVESDDVIAEENTTPYTG